MFFSPQRCALLVLSWLDNLRVEKLAKIDLKEQRRLADATLETFTGIDVSKPASVERQEVEIPGASFGVEYRSSKEIAPTEFEEGGTREFRMRVVFANQTLYLILMAILNGNILLQMEVVIVVVT